MTIGKKLYLNFGIILTTVVVLFLVNLSAVRREHAAKALADSTNAVRFQMMQNRLYLSNYLLSGDTREVDRMNEGLRTLNDKLDQGKNLANPTAIFLALSMLLYQIGEIAVGQAVKASTLDLLREGVRTRDLGGSESTQSFTEAVATEVARRLQKGLRTEDSGLTLPPYHNPESPM